LKNVANVNIIIHGIILRETQETARGWTLSRPEQNTSNERDKNTGDGTGGRECRVVVINLKKFPTSPITTISVEGLLPERIFMLDTGAEPNFIKVRSVYSDAEISREDKLHIGIRTVSSSRLAQFKSHSSA